MPNFECQQCRKDNDGVGAIGNAEPAECANCGNDTFERHGRPFTLHVQGVVYLVIGGLLWIIVGPTSEACLGVRGTGTCLLSSKAIAGLIILAGVGCLVLTASRMGMIQRAS